MLSSLIDHIRTNKKISIVILITFIFISAAIGAISQSTPAKSRIHTGMYAEPSAPDNSTLKVIEAKPKGRYTVSDRRKEIYMVFNHPLVPLATLDDETKGVFTISPSVKGKFRWYGSRICAFIPDKEWKPGQRYRITVHRGLTSLNKKRLIKDYSFNFTIAIKNLYTSISPTSYRTIDYHQQFTIRFSSQVNLAHLRRHLRIISQGRTIPYSIEYYNSTYNKNKRSIRLKLKRKLKRNSTMSIIMTKGLKTMDGFYKLSRSKSYRYRTHGPLNVRFVNNARYYQETWKLYLSFNNPVRKNEAISQIKISPAAPLKSHPRKYYTTRIYLSDWRLKPETTYSITVNRIRDKYGYSTGKPVTYNFYVPAYRPGFYIPEYNSIFESQEQKFVPVNLVNIPRVKVELAHYTKNTLLRNLNSRTFDRLDSETLQWETGQTGKAGTLPYDISPFLHGKKYGWLALRFTAPVIDWRGKTREKSVYRYFQATDLGLTVKEAYDKTFVWVHSLKTGKPVKDVSVELYNARSFRKKGFTDRKGLIILNKRNWKRNAKTTVLAAKGQDKAFVNSYNHSVSMYHLSNDYSSNAAEATLMGQIVFDRKLYRPGDTMKYKALLGLKKNGSLLPFKNKRVYIRIRNSRGKQILGRRVTSSREGGVWGSIVIPKDAPLGHYSLSVEARIGRNKKYINDTFQIEEFRPATFAVSLSGMNNIRAGKKLQAVVSGNYLFGAPMQKAQVTYRFTRKIKHLYYPQYSNYSFGDNNMWNHRYNSFPGPGYYSGASALLNNAGQLTISMKIPQMSRAFIISKPSRKINLGYPYTMTLEATVKDVDKKSVTSTSSSTVFPSDAAFGIRTVNRYQSFTKPFSFELVALKNNGKKIQNKKAEVLIIKEQWKSILSKGPRNTVKPKNVLVKELVYSRRISLSSKPKRLTYRAKSSGTYSIIVKEQNGTSFSRDGFYAFGKDFASWYAQDDDTITLTPDKPQYKPGDTAKILIQSPYKNVRAIISVERESVLSQKSIILKSNATVLDVPITYRHLPNIFFSVMIIRPRVEPGNMTKEDKRNFYRHDMGKPKFKAGIVKLKVSNSSKRAMLEVSTDKEKYGPGEKVTIHIKTKPGAEVALAVADRGVLDLLGYRYNNPLDTFFSNWPLGVKIFENRKHLIDQFRFSLKGNNPGGGGKGERAPEKGGGFDKDSENGTRKDFRYTAFWKPDIKADKKGNAVVSFNLPDNLTTFRVMAVTAARGTYGNDNKEFKVEKKVVIQKTLPRFIRPGDSLSMGAVVINQSGKDETFRVTMTSNLLYPSQNVRTVNIKNGEAKEISFTQKLNSKTYGRIKSRSQETFLPGIHGRISAVAVRNHDISDAVTFSFPVKEMPPVEAFTISGTVSKTNNFTSPEYIRLPKRDTVIPHMTNLSVTMSNSVLTGLNRAFSYYMANPYLCLEQRGSAFMLAMSSGKLLEEFHYKAPDTMAYDFSKIKDLFINQAGDFQNSDGGFRFWKSHRGASSPYLTAYISYVLTEASMRGYTVPERVLSRADKYLRSYVREPRRNGITYVLESFALINYTWALKGKPDKLTPLLVENMKKLSLRAQAYTIMAIALKRDIHNYKSDKTISRLYSNITKYMEVTTRKVFVREPARGAFTQAFYSQGSTLGVILRMMMTVDHYNPLIPKFAAYIMADRSHSYWKTSHDAGILALALYDYYKVYEEKSIRGSSYRTFITSKNGSIYQAVMPGKKLKVISKTLSYNNLLNVLGTTTQPFTFSSSPGKRFYYSATLSYAPRIETVKPRDEGIEVIHTITTLHNKNHRITGPLERGRLYLCTIKVINPKPAFNMVISDPIPANSEIVNLSFKTERQSLSGRIRRRSSGYSWYLNSTPFIEYKDDEVRIFNDYLSAGYHEYRYIIRPTLTGTAQRPAGSAKLMYEPEIFGRTAGSTVTVTE